MTTSAVNEKRRPPLTTFATRLISTTRSLSSRDCSRAITARSTLVIWLKTSVLRSAPRRDLERDPLRRLQHDRVRVPDVQPQVGPLHGRAIADALELESLLEPLRDALDHVRDQRTRQAVQ